MMLGNQGIDPVTSRMQFKAGALPFELNPPERTSLKKLTSIITVFEQMYMRFTWSILRYLVDHHLQWRANPFNN